MNFKDDIERLFEACHKGKGSAIKRRSLLLYLQRHVDPDIGDREMRENYEGLPMCGDEAGLYFPRTEKERRRQVEIIEKKIRSYWRKRKVLNRYSLNGDHTQLGFEFEEDEDA